MQSVVEKSAKIAVFCGARPGVHPEHLLLAEEFGTTLARRGLDLVYGAGGVGVMGAVADAVLAAGGSVTGVIPRLLHERERSDKAPGAVFVVRSMHERKALMYRLSLGFAVLPGGLGTLDELMEVATWNQLSIMRKPIVVVNHRGFFDPMLRMLDHLVEQGFLKAEERALIQVAHDAGDAVDRLGAGHAVPVPVTA
ncbi:LOG family protein [Streptomyces sp. NPDC055189]